MGKTRRASSPPPQVTQAPMAWRHVAVASVLLATVTIATFSPALSAGFLSWDDPHYLFFEWSGANVRDQPESPLRGAAGLAEIWNPASKRTEQYYPLVFTSYWIEHALWGLNPRPYHVTNLILHVAN